MKLNLGCGTLRIPGFVGVDFEPGPTVDRVVDLSRVPWPFETASAEEIRAWHFLEHLPGYSFHDAMDEIARILRPGGLLYVKVPYKEKGPYNPHHFRVFDRRTFGAWLPLDPAATNPDKCLQSRRGFFLRRRQEVADLASGFPLWHLERRFPRLGSLILKHDERDAFSLSFPSLWGRQRELREWLVKLPIPGETTRSLVRADTSES